MPPVLNISVVVVAVIIVALTSVSARVCVLVTEPDQVDGGSIKLVPPVGDPCTCSQVRLGGHNAYAPPRPDRPLYIEIGHLMTILAEGLPRFFHCVATETYAVSTGTENVMEVSIPKDSTDAVEATPADCQEILEAGRETSGVYTIRHAGQNMQVYCRMEEGKGYIVFQRRQDGSVSFDRTWQEYADGFGNLTGEFWLGNDKLYNLTRNRGMELVVTLRAFDGDEARVRYSHFEICSSNYRLNVSGFDGCGMPLGMEDSGIPDSAITASGKYSRRGRPNSYCQASHGRLNYRGTAGGVVGAWCPKFRTSAWLQVDLGWRTQVEGVTIQGSYDPWYEWSEWVTAYQAQFSNDQSTWKYVKRSNATSPQTFTGNTDQTTPATSWFDQPIQARFIRIRPTSYNDWPSMRMELIGCKGDSLLLHRYHDFSTPDDDNDSADRENCAGKLQAGWWHHRCSEDSEGGLQSNLNGLYHNGPSADKYMGIQWVSWKGQRVSLSGCEMMTRRVP